MIVGFAAEHGETKVMMIDAANPKINRTASNLGVKKTRLGTSLAAPRAA